MSKFDAPNMDRTLYPYVLPVAFHVVNHTGGWFGTLEISERELNAQLRYLRSTYHACGVEIVVTEANYWDAPGFLDDLNRNETSSHRLGWEERCLFTPTFRDLMVNVYFTDSVDNPLGAGRSHAIINDWLEPEFAGDRRFIGAAVIADHDRVESRTKYVTVSHEVGHIVLDTGHTYEGIPNLMSEDLNYLAPELTSAQCNVIRSSPFVLQR